MTAVSVVLEGLISVTAALKSGRRPIYAIYVREDRIDGATAELESLARAAHVAVERVSGDTIASYAGGKSHGGIVALAGPRTFLALDDLVPRGGRPFVVMLDGVEDPFNFGAAVRAIYAAGADGLVVPPRNWQDSAGIVARASAGASELIPTAVVGSALDAATFFRRRGLVVACATRASRSRSIFAADLCVPLFVIIGGEKRGLRRAVIEKADVLIHIPYRRADAYDLGTTSAAAIICFEVMRQRKLGSG
jgi:23S rRNA (guanosine2251-2'-O)-methyltransferase